MSSKKIAEFPNVEAKLQKPSKQSAFEKQRAEAEAKRAREAAETAAVLKEFEKSFDNDDEYGYGASRSSNSQGFVPRGPGFSGAPPGGAGRRHFGTSNLKSGPGSLGPSPNLKSGPGSLGPLPVSHGKKRGFDSYRQDRDRDGKSGSGDKNEPVPVSRVFRNSDDEESGDGESRADEAAVPRPTLRLSNIPPGTSLAMVKSLMPANLSVDNVKMIPAAGPTTERRSSVAIVTLSQETPATDMDAAVSALQRKYLGYGFYLSLHRHLSSTIASSLSSAAVVTSATSQPFGAKPVSQKQHQASATQHSFQRGFAPPTSFAPNIGGSVNRATLLHVPVKAPSDIHMLQLINKTIESLLEHGPEFEALLMSRPEVQQEEKWAWIWDARSEGGIWYRWRLWEIMTGTDVGVKRGRFLPLFDGSYAWKAPEKKLAYEYTTTIDEFVSESEYNSSEEEEEDNDGGPDQKNVQDPEITFLNPLDKAKLTHLLSRLPTTLSKVRKGDIARITAFALTHASRGAEEVVEMIVSNVERPFALQQNRENGKTGGAAVLEMDAEDQIEKDGQDHSGASLVGLYAVSDILSSSSTSGIRHAWRFRQIFETALRNRKTFETLGLMATKLQWGRLKAEKWKRSVGMILNLWEGWCVFPVEAQELFASTFENPPSAKPSEEPSDAAKKGKWKTVEANSLPVAPVAEGVDRASLQEAAHHRETDDIGEAAGAGAPMDEDDVDGEPLTEDDVEGEPMEEDDVEGEPMEDSDMDSDTKDERPGQSPEDDLPAASPSPVGGNIEGASEAAATHAAGAAQVSSKPAGPGRRRMRAVDMFVDSGASDEDN